MANNRDSRLCGRCGIKCYSEFCRDCKSVDPDFTRGGKTSRYYAAQRQAANKAWREFTYEMRRVGGKLDSRSSRKGLYDQLR